MSIETEAMEKIDAPFYGSRRLIRRGRMLLVFLANNGRLAETSKELDVNYRLLRGLLEENGCLSGRQKPKNQGAILQPDRVHQLALSYADQTRGEAVADLLKRYEQSMASCREARARRFPKQRRSVVDSQVLEVPTIHLVRPPGPAWWEHLNGDPECG